MDLPRISVRRYESVFATWRRLIRAVGEPIAGANATITKDAQGHTIKAAGLSEKDVLLSGTSPYTGVEQIPTATGWTPMPGTGSIGPIYESSGNTSLAGKVARVAWTQAGDWRFKWVGYTGSGPPPITGIGCPCSVPTTLTVSVGAGANPFLMYQAATIVWGPVPAGLAGLALGPNGFLSTALFTDSLSTDQFRYMIYCSGGFFALTRVYETSQFGSPYREAYRYRWLPGLFSSTCTPFLFPNGQPWVGSPPQVLSLSG